MNHPIIINLKMIYSTPSLKFPPLPPNSAIRLPPPLDQKGF